MTTDHDREYRRSRRVEAGASILCLALAVACPCLVIVGLWTQDLLMVGGGVVCGMIAYPLGCLLNF